MTAPREVFGQLSAGVAEGRFGDLSSLYAEDTVCHHPVAIPRPQLTEGRAGVHALFVGDELEGLVMNRHDVVIHETLDPEVIVAEFKYSAESTRTGMTNTTDNIQMLRVHDGLIAYSRDYHDYLKIAVLRGITQHLADVFAQAPAHELGPVQPRPEQLADRDSALGVFQRLCHGITDALWSELPALFAEETDYRHPFLPDSPVLTTREQVREHFAAVGESGMRAQAKNLVTYQTTDPEVIIGECVYEGRFGERDPFRVNNITALRVRDGLIVECREYRDHPALAFASGRLQELIASATDTI